MDGEIKPDRIITENVRKRLSLMRDAQTNKEINEIAEVAKNLSKQQNALTVLLELHHTTLMQLQDRISKIQLEPRPEYE